MLTLSRTRGEKIVIGTGIVVEVLEVRGGKVRLGITAPREVSVVRDDFPGRRPEPEGEQRRDDGD